MQVLQRFSRDRDLQDERFTWTIVIAEHFQPTAVLEAVPLREVFGVKDNAC